MRKMMLVAASTVPEAMFPDATHLGRSVKRMPDALRPPCAIAFANVGPTSRGLSEIYNLVLDGVDADTDLIFVHDDVYLNDWYLVQRVTDALERFDVVGLAGSINPDLKQPSWGLRFDADLQPMGWQPGLRRSGALNHFDYAVPNVSVYGPAPAACALLDGVFLAIRTSVVRERGLRFDPRFKFHFYDLDFCRTATQKGLRVGTWPIAVTHDSGGAYGSPEFREGARVYLDKWAEKPEQK
jgi:GT2 family glycosyltransferase